MTRKTKDKIIGGSVSNIPFKVIQPYNLAVLLTFYSPIIISIVIVSMSFIFQNFKGLIYLVWLILFSCLRNFMFELIGSGPELPVPDDLCRSVQYSRFGNNTFSMFFISFSLTMYLFIIAVVIAIGIIAYLYFADAQGKPAAGAEVSETSSLLPEESG